MAHELRVEEIYTVGERTVLTLTCPDCTDLDLGIEHHGPNPDRVRLVAEAQHIHDVYTHYGKLGDR